MEWSKLLNKKEHFIKLDVILSNTISAAFSQSIVYKVYKEKPENQDQFEWDEQKRKFRENIGKYLVEIEEKYDPINDHSERIRNFKEKIESENANRAVLMCDEISFGRAQKLVNMYLKYLWCLGKFDTPPHCPIDRGVLKIVGWKEYPPDPPWTHPEFTKEKYEEAIEMCKLKAAGQTLSEWELFLWRGISSASVDKPGRNKSEKYLQIK